MVHGATPALNRSRETRALTQSGYLMLLIWVLLAGVAAWAAISNATTEFQWVGNGRSLRSPHWSAS